MKTRFWLIAYCSWLIAASAHAQGKLEASDEAFWKIVKKNAPIEKIAGALNFTEGPVWVAGKKELWFSDIPAKRIVRWSRPNGDPVLDTFRKPSGESNGLTFDKQGRLVACEHGNRRISRTEADGKVVTLADNFEGKKLNSPNDLVVKSDGAIYFTDPPYGVPKGEKRELDFQGVFRLAPDGKMLTVIARDFKMPNGLAFSPDEKILYVDDTEGGQIRAFDVAADGSLTNGREFAKHGGGDGMKVDSEGNVYATGEGSVIVYDPSGKRLGLITPAEGPANCAFGGDDWKTLFMTARTGLYRLRVQIAGVKVP